MIEALVERDLPHIEDGDRDASRRLAEPLAAFIDGDLPGVGILHTANRFPPHKTMHLWHRGLVLKALSYLEPTVDYGDFSDMRRDRAYEMDNSTEPHTDDFMDRFLEDAIIYDISMALRLHTTGENQGALVTLANTAPGYYMPNGDFRAFRPNGEPRRAITDNRGYDPSTTAVEPGTLAVEQIQHRRPDQRTAVNEPTVYQFDQHPNASVLFRTRAHLGPVSIHGFEAPEDCNRFAHISDLIIQATSI